VVRTAQPITFSDFCQVADMQFLTHIRRGTSISVADFAPSSMPQDLSKALELLSVTSKLRLSHVMYTCGLSGSHVHCVSAHLYIAFSGWFAPRF
jgi:hypothetical protein